MFNYIQSAIKNPKFFLRSRLLLHPGNSISAIKNILSHNYPLLEACKQLTNDSEENLKKYHDEIIQKTDFHNKINTKYNEFAKFVQENSSLGVRYSSENPAGRLNRNSQSHAGYFLYVLVRSLKPKIVVETGVSGGESSSYILQALEDNDFGELHSIDLPPDFDQNKRGILFPPGKGNGWVIPENLKHRWHLQLGPSQDLLGPLLEQLENIDIFWHDSLHTYEHMLFEFDSSWKYIKTGGLVLSDDMLSFGPTGRLPVIDFALKYGKNIVVHNMMGGLKK